MTNLERDMEADRLARQRLGVEADPVNRLGNTPRYIHITSRRPSHMARMAMKHIRPVKQRRREPEDIIR